MLVEQQRGSSLRERASFLVLTQTLLLGLGELSETQHLLTAQRVYTVLEPPLLEVTRDEDVQVGWISTTAAASDQHCSLVLSSASSQHPPNKLYTILQSKNIKLISLDN